MRWNGFVVSFICFTTSVTTSDNIEVRFLTPYISDIHTEYLWCVHLNMTNKVLHVHLGPIFHRLMECFVVPMVFLQNLSSAERKSLTEKSIRCTSKISVCHFFYGISCIRCEPVSYMTYNLYLYYLPYYFWYGTGWMSSQWFISLTTRIYFIYAWSTIYLERTLTSDITYGARRSKFRTPCFGV